MARSAIKTCVLRRGLPVMAWVCALFAATTVCLASDPDEDDDEATSWYEKTVSAEEANREAWAGAEAFKHVWSLYTGSTYAPFGNLRQDGLRTRAVSAMSQYTYGGRRFDPVTGDAIWQNFRGAGRTTDLLVGYQGRLSDLTWKLFVGYQHAVVMLGPSDPETTVQGARHGAKGALELWYNLTPSQWASLDLTYATPFRSFSHRLRVATKATDAISVGAEAAAFGHQEGSTRRVGAFLRYDNGTHEVSGSVGWSMPRGDAGHAYGTVQWLYRF